MKTNDVTPKSPQIIDLAATEPSKTKGIQLVGCLQDYFYESDHKFQFDTPDESLRSYGSHLNNAKIIKRLAILDEKMYLILKDMSLIEVDGCVFLGWWNDGVVA